MLYVADGPQPPSPPPAKTGHCHAFTVRALPGRLSALSVSHSEADSYGALYGRAGRVTAKTAVTGAGRLRAGPAAATCPWASRAAVPTAWCVRAYSTGFSHTALIQPSIY
jgi:hypothetical protein